MKRTTIKEVAKEAGVSITTVSHVLSGAGSVSEQTKAHVLEVVERLHYVADFKGQNLKAKSMKVIGLFVRSLRGDYYGNLAQSIYEEGRNLGYDLSVMIADDSDKIMTEILNGRIDGAIILNDAITQKEEELLQKQEVPVVFLDREIAKEHMSSIVLDSFEAGKMAGEYLLSLGHRRMAHVYGEENNYDSIERLRGFQYALAQEGIYMSDAYIWKGAFEREAAKRSTTAFLEDGRYLMPDAVFASNDLSAFGCIEALQLKGYRIPEDISIIGCDDIELCEWYKPRLTTIHNRFVNQGQKAMQLLLAMLQNQNIGQRIKIRSEIVIRESCMTKK